jgi:hypothetical protein
VGRHSPPPPPGASPPPQWGIPAVISERLGAQFDAPFFERRTMLVPALSLAHFRTFMEHYAGPVQKLVESLAADPQKLHDVRQAFDAMAAPYFYDNMMHQSYLMTRARAV